MSFKTFKTKIRKKIGWVGLAEFTDDPVASNSLESWNSLFNNKRFLKSYIEPGRISFYTELVDKIKKSNTLENTNSIIDIGCGTGHLLSEIKKHYPNIKLIGSDFSEQALEVAKKTLSDATFLSFDIYNIPESLLEHYDAVTCTEVIEHLLYPEKALINLKSLLIDHKGILILSVPNGRRDTSEIHINFWSPESWKVLIESNFKHAEIDFFSIENNMTNLAIIKIN